MDEKSKNIHRVNKVAGLLNWARQNFRRFDDTRKSVLEIADNPPRRSIGPIHRLCRDIAYRRVTYEEACEKASPYSGYLRMAADEVLPAFNNYFMSNQIETVPELDGQRFKFPIGKTESGKTRSVPIEPTYVAIRGDTLIPTFLLGWTKVPYDHHQKRLISTMISQAVLTQQDYLGCDAHVLTFPRTNKWSNGREPRGWMVSQYADMTDLELQEQFDRYNRAVSDVIKELESRDYG
jgi:hypothetical protein